jgi:hypothetical protein
MTSNGFRARIVEPRWTRGQAASDRRTRCAEIGYRRAREFRGGDRRAPALASEITLRVVQAQ